MKVVITGGLGFVGRILAAKLLDRGELTGPTGGREPIESLVLLDSVGDPAAIEGLQGRVEVVEGDVTDVACLRSLIDRDDISVFHLASMVSAACELDFDRALGVNLSGAVAVLDACRARKARPRVVFASSIAAFGADAVLATVSDTTKLTPETTYGTTKAMCELLVNDYSRKGFVDGRSARLPTVIIRPGRPNAAASSWVSGIFREPLSGRECIVPVDVGTRVPLSGYRTVVENLIRLHEVDGDALGSDRGCNFPALNPSAEEMIETLGRVNNRPLGEIRLQPDAAVMSIFRGWAQSSSFARATGLGLIRDTTLEAIIQAYLEDFGGGDVQLG